LGLIFFVIYMRRSRENILEELRAGEQVYDLIIVGGGATGLGAAVDAANRGYRTLLLEQSDFAKGTSSRSTKLVHGGVRYLKQGNITLVMDALKERGLLLRNAPHLVHDLPFVIPSYKWWQRSFYGIGMKVYDLLSGRLSFGKSSLLTTEETVERIPTIERAHLRGGVVYHDGQFDDARLAINLAQTAEEGGATVVNYVRCTGMVKEGGRVRGIEAVDAETGQTFRISGRAVVNATGVFVDDLLEMDSGEASRLVAVSQGIHFVLPKRFLPGNHGLMVPETDDGRVLFAIPWHGHVVVGTTDTPNVRKSLEPVALEEERAFVMHHVRKYLAEDPCEADVLSVFAGLRPLVDKGNRSSTSKLSRDHTILVSRSGLITVTGGKWTTYRKMGEDVVNKAESVAGLDHRACGTATLRIHGWCEAADVVDGFGIYGADAGAVRSLVGSQPVYEEPLHPELPYLKGEVVWHIRNEYARTVEDILSRRTRALLLNASASREAAPAVAALLAQELGMSHHWAECQTQAYRLLSQQYEYSPKSEALQPAH
jgi:glycerol-3-phosphate dehydrogenase